MANSQKTRSNMEGRRASRKRGPSNINLADVNIDSDDSDEHDDVSVQSSSDELTEENLAAKKVRLAREYLERVEAASSSDDSEDEDDEMGENEDRHSKLTHRLRDRRLEQTGGLEKLVADKISQSVSDINSKVSSGAAASVHDIDAERQAKAWISAGHVRLLRGHDLSPTCVALQNDGSRALSGSKDHSVILWDVETCRKLQVLCPHWKKQHMDNSSSRTDGQILSVACSHDGRYAAVGSRDAVVRIYDVRLHSKQSSSDNNLQSGRQPNMVKEFRGHKGAITSLSFQAGSLNLYSASEDRCIRSYNLDEMVQLETLYGHQLGVTSIDCYEKERPVSVGRDRTARAWKLAEDTHMIYRGGGQMQPSECVSIIKDDWFLTGHEDGQLCLWSTDKKKPVVSSNQAHGANVEGTNRSIVSVGALRRSDLAVSGSCDGFMRLWKIQMGATKADKRDITECGQVPIHGYINDIAVGPDARFAVLAVGNEHRLGRWNPVARAKNRLAIVHSLSNESNK